MFALSLRDSGERLEQKSEELSAIKRQLAEEMQLRKKAEEELRISADEFAIIDNVGRIIKSTLNIDEVYAKFSAELKNWSGSTMWPFRSWTRQLAPTP